MFIEVHFFSLVITNQGILMKAKCAMATFFPYTPILHTCSSECHVSSHLPWTDILLMDKTPQQPISITWIQLIIQLHCLLIYVHNIYPLFHACDPWLSQNVLFEQEHFCKCAFFILPSHDTMKRDTIPKDPLLNGKVTWILTGATLSHSLCWDISSASIQIDRNRLW